ncbi:MAG TPA: hypothetical protein VFH91_10500 [Pyrinomonadaceae bacterium]|nr:hypothetical protein [Pyrinomonadaceae bacterium]
MKTSPARLIHVLIGKAVLETIFVAALALGFRASTFPPTFHGWGEIDTAQQTVAGWAVDSAHPWSRVEVQLVLDNELVATQVATLSRPDVAKAGWTRDEWHGYAFKLPALKRGAHEARVYAVHKSAGRYTMQLLGDPIRFSIDSDGTARDVPVRSR